MNSYAHENVRQDTKARAFSRSKVYVTIYMKIFILLYLDGQAPVRQCLVSTLKMRLSKGIEIPSRASLLSRIYDKSLDVENGVEKQDWWGWSDLRLRHFGK